jgi:hypothetical protein
VGGIHVSGFKDVEDFKKNIPMWKLRHHPETGKLVAGAYYKDRGGRKRVAVSSDGSAEGKKHVADIMVSDLKQGRSHGEQSGASLKFLVKHAGHEALQKHLIHPKDVEKITGEKVHPVPHDDPELKAHPYFKDHFYQREIGGKMHTKLSLGTPGKKIV